ncbi:MAG: GIY-YIG nuclease family protein [Patescibacteria group bacterium]|nr:GIY-YIG nuclease family protein [Patescibacteria group bacterium]
MITIYALRSQKDGRIYVGMTENLQRRMAEHNQGLVFSTKGFLPWKIIYREDAPDRVAARKREKFLKGGSGKEYLKKIPA